MIDYAEEIFNSIKTIAQKELEALHFDSTIEATITDVSRADRGIYTVTNGSVYFTAHSTDPNYKEKDVVLVTIPQSDYNQQKIIIGKKNRLEEGKPLNYTSPLSQMIDVTNNLVQIEKSNQKIIQLNKKWMSDIESLKNDFIDSEGQESEQEYKDKLKQINEQYKIELSQDSVLDFDMIANSDLCVWESEDSSGFIQEAYNTIPNQDDNTSIGLIWSARDYGILTILNKYNNNLNNLVDVQDYDRLVNYNKEWAKYFTIAFIDDVNIEKIVEEAEDSEIKSILNKYQDSENPKDVELQDYDQLIFYNKEWIEYFTITFINDIDIEEMKNSLFKEEIGLTRIGIKADFQTFLKQYDTVSGNYGLALCVGFRQPDYEAQSNVDQEEQQNNVIKSTIIQPYIFDSSNFFGNIYDSISSITQEAVFDISNYSHLVLSDIFLFAYQKKNFKNSVGVQIEEDNVPNIIVKNPYICLGIEKTDFKKDQLELDSFSNLHYNNENNNIKTVNLRWIHKDEDQDLIKSLTQDDFDQNYKDIYEIRWYRYKLGAKSPDKYMNMYWERFYGYYRDENNEIKEGNHEDDKDYATNHFSVLLVPNLEERTDTLYALIINTKEESIIARSNTIEFINEKEIDFNQYVKDINALSIKYNDNEEGNYFLYDSMHKLNESANGSRTLTAVFAEDIDNVHDKEVLKPPFESIRWIFPADNSMISVLNPLDETNPTIASLFTTFSGNSEDFIQEDDGNIIIYIQDDNYSIKWDKKRKVYELLYIGDGSEIDNHYISIPYVINQELDFSKGNNTVVLEVQKNKQLYIAQTSMLFGIFGTSGSGYNLNIVWDSYPSAFDISNPNEKIKGHIELYDNDNKLVPINNIDGTYEYNWYNFVGPSQLQCKQDGEAKDRFYISYSDDYNSYDSNTFLMNQLYILEVKLVNFGNYNLITRTPITLVDLYPGAHHFAITQIKGPKSIRYATDGSVYFDKTPYEIIFQKEENSGYSEQDNYCGQWKIISQEEEDQDNLIGIPKLVYNTNEAFDKIIEYLKQYPILLYLIIINTTNQEDSNDTNKLTSLKSDYFLQPLEDINISELKDIINDTTIESIISLNPGQSFDETKVINFINGAEEEDDSPEKTFYENLFVGKSPLIKQYKLLLNDKNSSAQQNQNNNLYKLLFILSELGDNNDQTKRTNNLSKQNWLNLQNNFSLLPSGIYINNLNPYGIQFRYTNDGCDYILLTQPIYVYQDNYPSPTLNKWEGELIIDENKKLILAKAMGAGRKEEDNKFSGVIFGDWTEDNKDTSQTGIYGFNHGAMSYAFREDGSAFIGNGNNKISFNEENDNENNQLTANITMGDKNKTNYISLGPGTLSIKGTSGGVQKSLLEIKPDQYLLQSLNYDKKKKTGTSIDLQDGSINGYDFSLNAFSENDYDKYSLLISSKSPFLKISRERKSKQVIIPTSADLFNTFEDYQQTFLQFIDNQYNNFLTLFDSLQKIQKIDNQVLIDSMNFDQREGYAKLILASRFKDQNELFSFQGINAESQLKDAYKKYCNRNQISLSNLNEKANSEMIITLYNGHKQEFLQAINSIINNISSSYGEISSLLLQFLNEEQKENLVSQLTAFLPATVSIDDNNKDKPIENIFNLDYVNNNKNQHLLYPKITEKKFNTLNNLFNTLMAPYNEKVKELEDWKKEQNLTDTSNWTNEQSITWNEYVNAINDEAHKIIQLFNMLQISRTKYFYEENYSYVYATEKDASPSTEEEEEDDVPSSSSEESSDSEEAGAKLPEDQEMGIEDNIEIKVDNNTVRMPYITFSPGYYSANSSMPTEKLPDNFTGFILKKSKNGYPVITSRSSALYNSHYVFKNIDDYTYETSVLSLDEKYEDGRPCWDGSVGGQDFSSYYVQYVYKGIIQLESSGDFRINHTSCHKPVVLTLITNPEIWNLREDKARFVRSRKFLRSKKEIGSTPSHGTTSYFLSVRYASEDEAYGLKKMELHCKNIVQNYKTAFNNLANHFYDMQLQYKKFFSSQFEATIEKNMKNTNYKISETGLPIYPENSYIGLYVSEDNDIILQKNDFYEENSEWYSYDYYERDTNTKISKLKLNSLEQNDFTSYSLYKHRTDYMVKLYQDNLIGNNIIYYFSNIQTCLKNINSGNSQLKQVRFYNFTDLGLKYWEESNNLYLNALKTEKQQEAEDAEMYFDSINWENDLINITNQGGYMTSKNYRPTMQSGTEASIEPTAYQGTNSQYWYQGLKGFIIDFTNDKFVLGNNARIEGYQTQFYPNQTDVFCRTFYISTGANFITQNNRDKVFDRQFFIEAYEGYPGRLQNTFYVKWNGDVYIGGNLRVKGDIMNY